MVRAFCTARNKFVWRVGLWGVLGIGRLGVGGFIVDTNHEYGTYQALI